MIPDFGGFLVKANSEGQPGPQDYSRTHADGANMMSDAFGTHGGIVLWRAFVYADNGMDRIRQAYDEFKPLDGQFGANALIQVKNGPLDFQPREPFSPLFGGMPSTPVALELQITKEYLGRGHAPRLPGPAVRGGAELRHRRQGRRARPVARIVDGTTHGYTQHRDLRRRQHRRRRELDGLALQPGQLVRVRADGVGPRRVGAGRRGRVDPPDLLQRSRPSSRR